MRCFRVIGTGLGVFFETSFVDYDQHIIIHGTPVWVLAELGLIVFIGLAVFAFNIFNSALLFNVRKAENACLLIIMAHFMVFGLLHEIFYYRVF